MFHKQNRFASHPVAGRIGTPTTETSYFKIEFSINIIISPYALAIKPLLWVVGTENSSITNMTQNNITTN